MEPGGVKSCCSGEGVKPVSESPVHAMYAATLREAEMGTIDSFTGCTSFAVADR